MAVYGLVRDLQVGIVWEHERQGTRDLLGRPLRLEKLHYDAPAHAAHIELGLRSTGLAVTHALQLGDMRTVGDQPKLRLSSRLIVDAERPSARATARTPEPCCVMLAHGHSILWLELLVLRLFLHVNTYATG